MANLNKVMLIGRLTRDPEVRTFGTGGKVAAFGFAVNNNKKNQQTGQWEAEPVFIDIKAFNRENGRKLADQVEQYFRKGQQFYIEGHLTFEQWNNPEGQKQTKLKVILDDYQFFEPRKDDGTGAPRTGMASAPRPASTQSPAAESQSMGGGFDESESYPPMQPPPQQREEEIPF